MTRQNSFAWKLYLIFSWIDRLLMLGLIGLALTDVITISTAFILISLTATSNVLIASVYADPEAKKDRADVRH